MTDPSPELVEAIEAKAWTIYEEALQPIATRFEFEPVPSKSETSGLPTVLLLGNHSAGKSSFINFLLGEDLQRTGIAPIDDGFTVITHAEKAADKDGAALITNPDLAWGELQRFGQTLVSHLKLRQIENPALRGLALIDSPGMIDAIDDSVDRGYDFPGVVRWFAERADVILFLFDPDKPGTTGETLRILTDSLAGLDHKLLLIFNKVDRFSTMRDFARAYGALCWNLGKAIPLKDLPHVYTTYLPVDGARESGSGDLAGLPVKDFDEQREEVRQEVQRAPQRRLDNVVSRLYQYTRRLRMHATVLDHLQGERRRHQRSYLFLGLVISLVSMFALYMEWSLISSEGWDRVQWTAITALIAGAVLGSAYGFYRWDRRVRDENLSLDALFERAYRRQLTLGEAADDLQGQWGSVKERVKRALEAQGTFPRLRRSEIKRMEKVLETEVPELRTEASQ
ncbi:MAG: dynamin family protein [Planctomycetes bacterium]|nr:dynamin family protein [Planctomycetota bacterium]